MKPGGVEAHGRLKNNSRRNDEMEERVVEKNVKKNTVYLGIVVIKPGDQADVQIIEV